MRHYGQGIVTLINNTEQVYINTCDVNQACSKRKTTKIQYYKHGKSNISQQNGNVSYGTGQLDRLIKYPPW